MLGRKSSKALHAGSAVAGIGSILTAADLTVCGGAGTLIAVALAGTEVFKKADAERQAAAQRLGDALDAEMAASGLTPGRLGLVLKMLPRYWPDVLEIAEGDRTAEKVLGAMVARIAGDKQNTEFKAREVADFKAIMGPALATALKPQTEAEAFQAITLKRQTQADRKQDDTLQEVAGMRAELSEMGEALLQQAEHSGQSDLLREEGITEKAIIRLAQRIAGETEDVGQAWLELQNAMDIAVRVSQEGRVGSNHHEFVDEVLRLAAEKFRGGDTLGALSDIEAALEEADAQKLRLLSSGAEYALLDGDTAKAADLLIRKADLEAGGAAEFAALRALRRGYYERGREKGVNLDLELSIDIARGVLNRAPTRISADRQAMIWGSHCKLLANVKATRRGWRPPFAPMRLRWRK